MHLIREEVGYKKSILQESLGRSGQADRRKTGEYQPSAEMVPRRRESSTAESSKDRDLTLGLSDAEILRNLRERGVGG